VPEDGQRITGSCGRDEEKRAGTLKFATKAERVGSLHLNYRTARHQTFAHADDDHVLIFESLEAEHCSDMHTLVATWSGGADFYRSDARVGQRDGDFLGHGVGGYADRDLFQGDVAPPERPRRRFFPARFPSLRTGAARGARH
jgi:hypothetical protein